VDYDRRTKSFSSVKLNCTDHLDDADVDRAPGILSTSGGNRADTR
jgi:hypothetical protein